MNATPRTDEKTVHVSVGRDGEILLWPDAAGRYVDADFARTLERENASLRSEVERLKREAEKNEDASNIIEARCVWHQQRAETAEAELAQLKGPSSFLISPEQVSKWTAQEAELAKAREEVELLRAMPHDLLDVDAICRQRDDLLSRVYYSERENAALRAEVERLKACVSTPTGLRVQCDKLFPDYAWESREYVAQLRTLAERAETAEAELAKAREALLVLSNYENYGGGRKFYLHSDIPEFARAALAAKENP